MSEKTYRTVAGFVQFDPKEAEAAGKQVRNIVIREVGFAEQSVRVYVTVWPSHADFEIKRGDFLAVEGSYSRGSGRDKDDNKVTYHNLSASKIAKLGEADEGKRPDVENDTNDDDVDSDLPF